MTNPVTWLLDVGEFDLDDWQVYMLEAAFPELREEEEA